MLKRSFFNRQDCAVTLLCKPSSIAEAIALARSAECDGADGIAIEIQRLPEAERSLEKFQAVINSVQLPFMFIDYRDDIVHGSDDAARQQYLLTAAEAGAEVIDVPGDTYAPAARELTFDVNAIARQQQLIGEIHARGAKVIMSSHMTHEALGAEEVLAHLLQQVERGADIAKIVTRADNNAEALEAVRTMMLLQEKMPVPFVYLCGGKFSRFVRYNGMQLGVAIEFGVHDYNSATSYNQPTISSFNAVKRNFNWRLS